MTEDVGSLALLVVNYGSHALLDENLGRTETPPGTRVIVVDNKTSEQERDAVSALCQRRAWQLLTPATNLGFGAGMNLAAEAGIAAGADVLVLLNPDAWIDGDGLRRLAERARAERSALVSPLVLRPGGGHFASEMELDLDTGVVRRKVEGRTFKHSQPWLSGACVATSVEMWSRAGGFDDDYFLYWEDVDLSRAVLAAGGSLVVAEDVTAVHDPGGTQRTSGGSRAKSAVYYFYNTRNRLVFAAKHLPVAQRDRWARRAPRAAFEILLRGGRRQFARPMRTLAPALAGTVSGLLFLRRSVRARRRLGAER